MIKINDKDFDDAVTKAVLLMGPEPSATQLIKNLKTEFVAIFNKAGIEVVFEK